jgi:hypothetical protein
MLYDRVSLTPARRHFGAFRDISVELPNRRKCLVFSGETAFLERSGTGQFCFTNAVLCQLKLRWRWPMEPNSNPNLASSDRSDKAKKRGPNLALCR